MTSKELNSLEPVSESTMIKGPRHICLWLVIEHKYGVALFFSFIYYNVHERQDLLFSHVSCCISSIYSISCTILTAQYISYLNDLNIMDDSNPTYLK